MNRPAQRGTAIKLSFGNVNSNHARLAGVTNQQRLHVTIIDGHRTIRSAFAHGDDLLYAEHPAFERGTITFASAFAFSWPQVFFYSIIPVILVYAGLMMFLFELDRFDTTMFLIIFVVARIIAAIGLASS